MTHIKSTAGKDNIVIYVENIRKKTFEKLKVKIVTFLRINFKVFIYYLKSYNGE